MEIMTFWGQKYPDLKLNACVINEMLIEHRALKSCPGHNVINLKKKKKLADFFKL